MSDNHQPTQEPLSGKQLLQEIERLRIRLYKQVDQDPSAFSDPQILKLSQRLDELITLYVQNQSRNRR
jgi:hypothetical protein